MIVPEISRHPGWHKLQPLITQEELDSRIDEMAKSAAERYKDDNVIFLRIREGGDKFANVFEESANKYNLSFESGSITVQSMEGTESNGTPKVIGKYIGPDMTDRKVVLIEDILDTGKTIDYLTQLLAPYSASVIEAIVLFAKSERVEVDVSSHIVDVGFNVSGFVVGFNTDWDNYYRELPGLWLVKFWPTNLKELWKFLFPKKPVKMQSPLNA